MSQAGSGVRTETQWGTVIGLDVRDPVAPSLLDEVFEWFRTVDERFSTWRQDSEVCRLASGQLSLAGVSTDVREVLALCEDVHRWSDGAFDVAFAADPRVDPAPGRSGIDPSALVKGWALDRAAQLLEAGGASNFSINAGGDLVVRGRPGPERNWRVGIQHPRRRDRVAAVVSGEGIGQRVGIATSGRYERGEHIIDPRTGRPALGLVSATAIAAELWLADACATTAIVLGEAALPWLESIDGVEAMLITDTARVVATSGFSRYRR